MSFRPASQLDASFCEGTHPLKLWQRYLERTVKTVIWAVDRLVLGKAYVVAT